MKKDEKARKNGIVVRILTTENFTYITVCDIGETIVHVLPNTSHAFVYANELAARLTRTLNAELDVSGAIQT